MITLNEAISTFDIWVSPSRLARANAKYLTASATQAGQNQILQDAAGGSAEAADFLFDLLKKVIAKAFWNYYLGPDRSKHAARISSGAAEDFASVAYAMLLGGGDPSPYNTFKSSKFAPSANLLRQFGYYVYRYLQNEAFKMIRGDKMQGMTGNVANNEDVQVAGYEDHFENDEQASTSDDTGSVDEKETIRAFLDHLKTIKKVYYDVFRGKLKGLSTEDVAAKLGISGQSVRNHLKDIKSLYVNFIGE